MGDSQISGTWTPLDRELHINCLELKAVGAVLHHCHQVTITTDNSTVSYNYQQARRDPVPLLVTSSSRAFYVVTSSEHSSPSKTHSRLSERDSRPPISSQSADNDRVESPSRNRESNFRILGDSSSGQVCNCFKIPPFSVHISNSGAMSTSSGCSVSGLAGKIDVHVSTISPAQQSHSETTGHTGGRGNLILIAPWWPKQSWFLHLLHLCVDHPLFFPYRQDLLSQQDQKYVWDGKS